MSPVSEERAEARGRRPTPRRARPSATPAPEHLSAPGRRLRSGGRSVSSAMRAPGLLLLGSGAGFRLGDLSVVVPVAQFQLPPLPRGGARSLGRLLEPPAPSEDAAAAESKVERLGQAFGGTGVRRLRELSERLVGLLVDAVQRGPSQLPQRAQVRPQAAVRLPCGAARPCVCHRDLLVQQRGAARRLHISFSRRAHHHKAAVSREISAITYRGGGTYTKGAPSSKPR